MTTTTNGSVPLPTPRARRIPGRPARPPEHARVPDPPRTTAEPPRPAGHPYEAAAPGPVCAACGTAPGTVWSRPLARSVWAGPPGLPLCAHCAGTASGTPDREPVLLGDLLAVTAAALRISTPPPTAPEGTPGPATAAA
ncbi:hypothetical protein [Streptomyces sp. NPDC046887]|uniref:hypothetical protein n=1 Tax=Streptomyces sp. NPDC046887 TaxID=3155472 RepID=UPI0033C59B52